VECIGLIQLRAQFLDSALVGRLGGGIQEETGIPEVQTHSQLGFANPGP
jgi:hypothetical protein